jgi:hypothetical protein
MTTSSSVQFVLQTVLFLICFLCSWINLFDNIKEYLEYRHVVTTRLVSNQQVVLPAVSICTSNYFDMQKVQQLDPLLYEEFDRQDLNERGAKPQLLARLNFSQIVAFAYTYDQVVHNCAVYDSNMQSVNCEVLGPVRVWYSFDTLCFQWFASRTGNEASRFRFRREDLVELHWILISLHKPIFQKRHVGLLVSRPEVPLQPFYTNSAFVKSSVVSTQSLVVTFVRVITHRLPAPYKSDCLHYESWSTGRLVNQQNCSFSCLSNRLASTHMIPEILLLERQSASQSQARLHFTSNYSHLLHFCQLECAHPDCEHEDYELQVKYEKLTPKNESTFQVKIVYNYESEKVIVYQPLSTRVQLTSIIAFIFSPLAFWLGISFYHVNCWCIQRATFIRTWSLRLALKIRQKFIQI